MSIKSFLILRIFNTPRGMHNQIMERRLVIIIESDGGLLWFGINKREENTNE